MRDRYESVSLSDSRAVVEPSPVSALSAPVAVRGQVVLTSKLSGAWYKDNYKYMDALDRAIQYRDDTMYHSHSGIRVRVACGPLLALLT